jgi:hypothetical protein
LRLQPWSTNTARNGRINPKYRSEMILTSLDHVTADEFAAGTGWAPKPQGLCRGEVCVPAPDALRDDNTVDVTAAAQRLGMPIVHDATHGVWALGSATTNGKALATATAADPTLLTRSGERFQLSSLRGRKVVLVAWSTY